MLVNLDVLYTKSKEHLKKKEAIQEAYEYFQENIHPFERDDNGRIKAHNNDVDAFRHAYVSAVMTQKYGDFRANILGQLQELDGDINRDQPEEEKNMDLWNNSIGRKYGKKTKSRKKLAELLKEAFKNGDLIITIDQSIDSRKYGKSDNEYIDPKNPVIVIKENKTGRNEIYLDPLKGEIMNREGFVSKIGGGQYPGYTVATIEDLSTPMSKADTSLANNLG